MQRAFRTTAAGAAQNLGVCIVAGCALIAAATWATADSTPRRQSRGTHVGAAPSDLVVLSFSGNYSNQKFVRVHDDGTIDTTEFAVPAGQHLIVTDVDWTGLGAASTVQDMLRVWIENRTTSSTRSLVYTAYAVLGTITGSGSTNYGGVNSGTVTGFAVAPSGRVVCDVVPHGSPTATFTTTGTGPVVILRGYLVQDA